MYSKRNFWCVLVLSFGFLPEIVQALDSSLKPYVGLEYVQRSLVFEQGYGEGNFNKRLTQGDLLVGLELNDYFGIEIGYLFSQFSKRTTVSSGKIFGKTFPADFYLISENKINLTGPQLNIVGHIPLGNSDFSGIGSLGISYMELDMQVKPLGDKPEPTFSFPLTQKATRNFSAKKVIPKLMFGVGYALTDSIGLRLMIGYQMTNRFKNIAPKEASPFRISLKNNTLCSLGIFVHF